MTIVFDANVIRRNFFLGFKEIVFMWHIAELSNTTRRIFIYEENVDEWIQILMTKFKFQSSTAILQLLRKKYTMNDVWQHRESKKYAQKIIRCVKSAEMNSVFNQLNMMYNEINVKFRRDLRKLTNITLLNEYFLEFDACKDIW